MRPCEQRHRCFHPACMLLNHVDPGRKLCTYALRRFKFQLRLPVYEPSYTLLFWSWNNRFIINHFAWECNSLSPTGQSPQWTKGHSTCTVGSLYMIFCAFEVRFYIEENKEPKLISSWSVPLTCVYKMSSWRLGEMSDICFQGGKIET